MGIGIAIISAKQNFCDKSICGIVLAELKVSYNLL